MDHQRHAAALTDEAVGDEIARDIARALAVDPSPEFLARVRTQIANEPAPTGWKVSWLIGAVGAVTAAVIVAVIANRPGQITAPAASEPLSARATVSASAPYVASGFRSQYGMSGYRRTAAGPAEAGRPVLSLPLLDPRETQALRALLAGVSTHRVDLSPLLRPSAPAQTELPLVDTLVIAPLAIEPLAPIDGAQGERQ